MKNPMRMIKEMLDDGSILELHGGPGFYTAEIIESKHGDTIEAAIRALYDNWKHGKNV